jgi:hypothetical protein
VGSRTSAQVVKMVEYRVKACLLCLLSRPFFPTIKAIFHNILVRPLSTLNILCARFVIYTDGPMECSLLIARQGGGEGAMGTGKRNTE